MAPSCSQSRASSGPNHVRENRGQQKTLNLPRQRTQGRRNNRTRHSEKDLEHALKDIGHALNDFKHAIRDLAHLDSDLAAVVPLAEKAGVTITLSEVKAYVVAQAKA
jgi:hypothetical protein